MFTRCLNKEWQTLEFWIPSNHQKPAVQHITLHQRHFKRHFQWPVVHQQIHVIRNTNNWPITQASYTEGRVRSAKKINRSRVKLQQHLVSFPRWCQESLKSGQQRMSLTSNPRPICVLCKCQQLFSTSLTGIDGMQYHFYRHLHSKSSNLAELRLFLFTTKQVNGEQLPPTIDFVTRLWKVQTSSHWYGHKMKGPTR